MNLSALPAWLRGLWWRPSLSREQAQALAAWRALPGWRSHAPLAELRWVVVDVESSGLDVWHDRLISIGAVAVHGGGVDLADSLEVVLRQERVSETSNILVHGLGGTVQRMGLPPQEALLRFLAWARKDPLVAFHAGFDTLMIGRALKTHLGVRWRPRVIDLADLLPALFPEIRDRRQLDDWLAHFGIDHYARHQALSDAYATAQLWLVALARARTQGLTDWAQLHRLQRSQRALRRLGGFP